MRYMMTDEPDAFAINKGIELSLNHDVLILARGMKHVKDLCQRLRDKGYISDCLSYFPLHGNHLYFRASTCEASLHSIPFSRLILMETIPERARMLAIHKTLSHRDTEIWSVCAI